jgi:DNA polymerase-3 subunit delta'
MSFASLKHQKHAVALLQRSLRSGRLAHAYLFIGGSATERAALARAVAKALNCDKGGAPGKFLEDGCGQCPTCKKIEADSHPDVHWVHPESKSRRILTDKMRTLEKEVYLKAREGRVKVGVVVDADRLVANAANAFLKTLEEPPRNCVLLLLTSDPQPLLPTVRSRCLAVRLMSSGNLSAVEERALALIAGAASQDRCSFVAARYGLLAQLNALLEALHQQIEARLKADWEVEKWGGYDENVREQLKKELEAAIEAEYLSAREQVLAVLLAWQRDLLVTVEGADEKLLLFPRHRAVLQRLASRLRYEQAAANIAAIEGVRRHLEQNISESLALEVGLLQLRP